jgi:hypothetical protein
MRALRSVATSQETQACSAIRRSSRSERAFIFGIALLRCTFTVASGDADVASDRRGMEMSWLDAEGPRVSSRPSRGIVTLSHKERERAAPRTCSGGRDHRAPRVHRRGAEAAVSSC